MTGVRPNQHFSVDHGCSGDYQGDSHPETAVKRVTASVRVLGLVTLAGVVALGATMGAAIHWSIGLAGALAGGLMLAHRVRNPSVSSLIVGGSLMIVAAAVGYLT